MLIGRGANDMKSAIAAFVAAAASIDQQRGTISLLITGDEEGPADLRHRRDHRLAARARVSRPT